jgi:hypothetical protein
MGQTFCVVSEGGPMSTFNRITPARGMRDRCQELIERLGDVPLAQLTPEERRELREATRGMFRPSGEEPDDRPRHRGD